MVNRFARLALALAALSAIPLRAQSVDSVIEGLKKQTDTFDAGAKDFVLLRPHPLLATLPPGSEPAIAAKMTDSFSTDSQKDIYVRYHLMYALTHPTGKPVEGATFVRLAKDLPKEIPFKAREWDIYDPPEKGARYRQLISQSAITVGFPPFERWVGPPESFQYMDGPQKAKAQGLYNEALELAKQFTRTQDANARFYNERVGKTPFMLKQVRGESLYGQLVSGEPAMLDAVVQQIGRLAATDKPAAEEAIEFFNAAYFDGWLAQYPPDKLKAASAAMKRAVIVGDAPAKAPPTPPTKGKPGAKPPAAPAKTPPQPPANRLSERAFTVITAMETGNVPSRPSDGRLEREASDFKALRPRKVTPETIDPKMIDDAVDRAIAALEKVRPPDTDLGRDSYWAVGIAAWLEQWILPGNQALANWAFLSTGEGLNKACLRKRIGWVACFESASTYDRAMRLRMLSELPAQLWRPWLKRDASWLLSTMTEQGNFDDGPGAKGKLSPYGDNANGQYAILALGALHRAGYEVDTKTWKQIDKYWRDAQFPAGHKDAGGWAVRSFKDIPANAGTGDFTVTVSAPMTAGGVLALTTTERVLLGPTRLDTSGKTSPELAAGLKWLDSNFAVQAARDNDLYYYLWTVQNVGQATGYRKFNNIDWFREATATLLNQQGPDGLWKGPKGPTVSTSFALLYLYRARGPLAFSKVRFGDNPSNAAWNNRPNDLMNLTEDITESLEVPTNWQIADLDQPISELAESATLYLTTDQPFTLKPPQVQRLRDYVQAGGMLILAPEGGATGPTVVSLRGLAKQIEPEREFTKMPADHPINSINRKLTGKLPVSILDNGVRPTVVLIEKDVSRELQANVRKNNETFDLMTNLYLFAAGRDQRRPRVEINYVQAPAGSASESIAAARVKYDGNFDPEPLSLQQLGATLAKQHKTSLAVSTATPSELTPQQKIAFLTMTDGAKLTDDQGKALRKWIDAGGTLWLDAAGGRAASNFAVEQAIARLGYTPADTKPITDAPVSTGKTRRPGGYDLTSPATRASEGQRPSIQQIRDGDRASVYVVRGDLAGGLAGTNAFGIVGYTPDASRKFVINSMLDLAKTK